MDASVRLNLRQRIRAAVEPTVIAEGFRLVAIELTGDSTGNIVRLYCDGPEFGIDDCARISRALSPVLDVEDPMESRYRLEVSSPGINRPVQTTEDFIRFAGFRAKLRLIPGVERRRYTGVLKGVEDDNIVIEVDGAIHHVPIDEMDWGHLVLDLEEFNQIHSAANAEHQQQGAEQ
jgi:ribosome maturation factor RimP